MGVVSSTYLTVNKYAEPYLYNGLVFCVGKTGHLPTTQYRQVR